MSTLAERAEKLARRAHEGQFRKDGVTPYITHPERLVCRLKTMRSYNPRITDEMVAAAWLHDVGEDCPHISEEEILTATNTRVLWLVRELTNPSKQFKPDRDQLARNRQEPGFIRKIKKKMDREHIAHASWEAKFLKMLDRDDNLGDIVSFDPGFALLYAGESQLLLDEGLRGVDAEMEARLQASINRIILP